MFYLVVVLTVYTMCFKNGSNLPACSIKYVVCDSLYSDGIKKLNKAYSFILQQHNIYRFVHSNYLMKKTLKLN